MKISSRIFLLLLHLTFCECLLVSRKIHSLPRKRPRINRRSDTISPLPSSLLLLLGSIALRKDRCTVAFSILWNQKVCQWTWSYRELGSFSCWCCSVALNRSGRNNTTIVIGSGGASVWEIFRGSLILWQSYSTCLLTCLSDSIIHHHSQHPYDDHQGRRNVDQWTWPSTAISICEFRSEILLRGKSVAVQQRLLTPLGFFGRWAEWKKKKSYWYFSHLYFSSPCCI